VGALWVVFYLSLPARGGAGGISAGAAEQGPRKPPLGGHPTCAGHADAAAAGRGVTIRHPGDPLALRQLTQAGAAPGLVSGPPVQVACSSVGQMVGRRRLQGTRTACWIGL
jgi:hypothetical protein